MVIIKEKYNIETIEYMEFEKTEKIKIKRWRGEKGEMKFWNKPDRIVYWIRTIKKQKNQEPKRSKKEYFKTRDKQDDLRGLNKLKQEYDNKIPS